MKRNRRAKNINIASFAKDAAKAMTKKLIGFALVLVVLLAVFMFGKAYIYRSNYFKLNAVETKGTFLDQAGIASINNQLLSMYKGTNVFRLNLKGIAQSLGRSYPDTKEIIARIVLPDKLSVVIKFRKPIAIIKDGKSYPIDEDGFVLPSVEVDSLRDLPFIEGVRIRYDERKGKQSSSKNLRLALELIKEIKRSKGIGEYGIVTIYANDVDELSFTLRNGIEVRIGYENLDERLGLLENTLKDERLALDRIKYIDVRFKDVVIGPK